MHQGISLQKDKRLSLQKLPVKYLKISEILFEEGMKVEKGQVLARLDDRILQAELDLNEAEHIAAKASLIELEVELKYALRQFHRSNNLFDKKSIGIAELDKATVDVHILRSRKERLKREIDVSEKSIKVKKQTLEDTIIRAPFSGVVISKDAQPGEMVSPMSAGGGFVRTGLSTIVDMESLEIEVDINENYINRIMVNQSATATLNAYPDWSIPVSVIAIVPTADRKKATVKVKLALKEQDSRIIPDLGVKVSFHKNLEIESIAATREVAMLIPTQVLQPDNQSDQVYVIVNNRVQVRDTELLGERGKWRRVSSGVREGDQVIISSSRQLRSGELVTVKN